MKIDFQNLEKKIKITFKDKNLLIRSMTHKSFNKEINNEKVEFLGDRVLGLVMAKKLLEIYPNEKEGILDKKFASLVNKKTCLEIAKKLELQKYVLTLSVKSKKKIIEDKVLADSCEALIGSIYLDQGLKNTEKFILKYWKSFIDKSEITQIDHKTKLQEYTLKKYKELPKYTLNKQTGPHHNPNFKINVQIPNSKTYTGKGNSKKKAQQEAAKKLLLHYKILWTGKMKGIYFLK